MGKKISRWFFSKANDKLSSAYSIACILLSVSFQSRAFFIGGLVALCFTIPALKQLKRKSLVILTALFISVPTVAFLLKTDSTKGRLLIYKISFQILHDHYPKGIGLGNFQPSYADYQLDYFRRGNFTTKELLLADNTVYAFNDYLQFLIETGLAGTVILGMASAFFLWMLFGKVICYDSELKKIFAANLLILGVAALFTPIFCHSVFQLLFIFSVLAIFYLTYNKRFPVLNTLTVLLALPLITAGCLAAQKYNERQNLIEQARQLLDAGFLEDAYAQTAPLADRFSKDVEFLSTYADLLIARSQFVEAAKVLHLLESRRRTNTVYTKLAKVYYELQHFKECEEYYLKAIYLVPNRFNSRYNLFDFYMQTNQFTKARKIGMDILGLPVKIKSYRVDRLKSNVESRLGQLTI